MSKKRPKTLIVVRHAHRDKSKGRELDNGLSPKGKKQVKVLTKQILSLDTGDEPVLLTSPKKRCMQTLESLAKKTKMPVKVEGALDEQRDGESDEAYRQRVANFFATLKKDSAPVTILCSHGDFIPLLAKEMIGVEIDLDKGGWFTVEMTEKPQLRWVVQEKLKSA